MSGLPLPFFLVRDLGAEGDNPGSLQSDSFAISFFISASLDAFQYEGAIFQKMDVTAESINRHVIGEI
jgi:hypothetical protein